MADSEGRCLPATLYIQYSGVEIGKVTFFFGGKWLMGLWLCGEAKKNRLTRERLGFSRS